VTVIVVPAVAPVADNVAVTVPSAAVEAPDTLASVPELAASVTGTPLSALLFASFARTVIVAELDPSDGMLAALLETATLAGTTD
jgi:hypothetical protein